MVRAAPAQQTGLVVPAKAGATTENAAHLFSQSMDCFRLRSLSYGGQVAWLAMTAPTHMPKIPAARIAPEACLNSAPFKQRARGNAGCPVHPQPRVRWGSEKCTRVISGRTGNHPASPHAMVLTASFVISPAIGSFATVAPQRLAAQELDASVEASGPHDFSVRLSAVRQKRCPRPPQPVPTFVTMANAPLRGTGWRSMNR